MASRKRTRKTAHRNQVATSLDTTYLDGLVVVHGVQKMDRYEDLKRWHLRSLELKLPLAMSQPAVTATLSAANHEKFMIKAISVTRETTHLLCRIVATHVADAKVSADVHCHFVIVGKEA